MKLLVLWDLAFAYDMSHSDEEERASFITRAMIWYQIGCIVRHIIEIACYALLVHISMQELEDCVQKMTKYATRYNTQIERQYAY